MQLQLQHCAVLTKVTLPDRECQIIRLHYAVQANNALAN